MKLAVSARGKVGAVPMKDQQGRDVMVAILKRTFAVSPAGVEDDPEGPEPYWTDLYNGEDPAASSIRKPSDLYDFKPGTEVILIGHAHPPSGSSATHVDVSLRIGPIAKTVRAHGLRVWKSDLSPGPALPIREPVPLVYELAWGGMDFSDPRKPVGEPRNYLGRGVARDTTKLVGQPAAQLEDPARPVRGIKKDVPWCFGSLHRHWEPRKQYTGTYDDVWSETKAPLLPDDFDARHYVSVPPEQWSAMPLRGDEPVEVLGATPEGPWRFQLPRVAPGFSSITLNRDEEHHRTHLDTILIDADEERVELTWRAAIPLPRKFEMLELVQVFDKRVI